MLSAWNSSIHVDSSPPSSASSSVDEDEVNLRHGVRPHWPSYDNLLRSRGFRLDTVKDVKEFYRKHGLGHLPPHLFPLFLPTHLKPHRDAHDDDALCPDCGLPDNLFRGTQMYDGQKVVLKAVHLGSREYDVIQLLSSSPLRDDPRNHTIPVLDFIEVPDDNITFIVMEQWSSYFVPDTCCLKLFLAAIRQCIEHIAFMHENRIAHLDISMRNLVTDYEGHYAYIDYESSRRFGGLEHPFVSGYKGTEVPPESEKGQRASPYGIDIWALGITILRACKAAEYGVCIPELLRLVDPMICENPEQRPTASAVLSSFDNMVASIPEFRLRKSFTCSHR